MFSFHMLLSIRLGLSFSSRSMLLAATTKQGITFSTLPLHHIHLPSALYYHRRLFHPRSSAVYLRSARSSQMDAQIYQAQRMSYHASASRSLDYLTRSSRMVRQRRLLFWMLWRNTSAFILPDMNHKIPTTQRRAAST